MYVYVWVFGIWVLAKEERNLTDKNVKEKNTYLTIYKTTSFFYQHLTHKIENTKLR